MRAIMVTGAQTYDGFIRDFTTWRDLHRPLPDAIVVPHDFVAETLVNVDDNKRLSWPDEGRTPHFLGVPVICMCTLHALTVDISDCPLTGHEALAEPTPAEGPETPPARVAKKTKSAKSRR